MIQVAYAIVWWLILVVIGLITFPSYPGVWRGSWDEVLGRDMDVDNIYNYRIYYQFSLYPCIFRMAYYQ